MPKVLKTTTVYRCLSQAEADALVEDMRKNGEGEVTKTSIELKQKKSKGLVIDENYKVTIQMDFAPQFEVEEEE